jgi:hypothetical protein
MKLTRDTALKALVALLLVAAAAWIASNTEWVDIEEPVTPHGEAARDPLYAVKQLVRRLGANVVAPPNFERLPPPGATLVLSSQHWNMFAGRDRPLRHWVESGGHLVIDDLMLADDKLFNWIPIRHVTRPAADAASAASIPLPTRRSRLLPQPPSGRCPELAEPVERSGAFGAPRSYRICGGGIRVLRTTAEVQWSLVGAQGAEFLRVPVGRGFVTARSGYGLFDNLTLFRADHALATIAMLRLQPGDEVWFIADETRAPLLAVIWNSGAPAVLLGALVLGLALWRGAVRFGPAAPTAALARRSVAEQIRGTAHFIWLRNGAALHRAQLRALDEAARTRVHQHDRLDRRARAEAIAKLTALDAEPLLRAMDPSLPRRRGELPHTLTLLESARRRLMTR